MIITFIGNMPAISLPQCVTMRLLQTTQRLNPAFLIIFPAQQYWRGFIVKSIRRRWLVEGVARIPDEFINNG